MAKKKNGYSCRRCKDEGVVFEYVVNAWKHIKCPDCLGMSKYRSDANPDRCFIATAAYGSPFALEVNIFRQFRDEFLLKSKAGKMFVTFYYWASPPLALMMKNNSFLRNIVRNFALNPILKFIKTKVKKKV